MHKLRKASITELEIIWSLYCAAIILGKENGSCDWSDYYPTREILTEDLMQQRLFLLEEDHVILAAVTILETDDLDHEPLGWTNVKSCVPVRLCVKSGLQGNGIGQKTMCCLADYAWKAGYRSIRLLAAVVNPAANRLYEKLGYHSLGRVHLYEKDFNAYEWILGG